ncbi:hypothetical protein B932_0801 [Gluconobacter oxydans H24]|nr:hypothetical protein B932_0801 [Gluconobacter oxydans H24]
MAFIPSTLLIGSGIRIVTLAKPGCARFGISLFSTAAVFAAKGSASGDRVPGRECRRF